MPIQIRRLVELQTDRGKANNHELFAQDTKGFIYRYDKHEKIFVPVEIRPHVNVNHEDIKDVVNIPEVTPPIEKLI